MKVRIAVYRIKGEPSWVCSVCYCVIKGDVTKDGEDESSEYGYVDREWISGGCTMCGALPAPPIVDC